MLANGKHISSTTIFSLNSDQLREKMLSALQPLIGSKNWGMYIVSCYYHTQAIDGNLWNGATEINGTVCTF